MNDYKSLPTSLLSWDQNNWQIVFCSKFRMLTWIRSLWWLAPLKFHWAICTVDKFLSAVSVYICPIWSQLPNYSAITTQLKDLSKTFKDLINSICWNNVLFETLFVCLQVQYLFVPVHVSLRTRRCKVMYLSTGKWSVLFCLLCFCGWNLWLKLQSTSGIIKHRNILTYISDLKLLSSSWKSNVCLSLWSSQVKTSESSSRMDWSSRNLWRCTPEPGFARTPSQGGKADTAATVRGPTSMLDFAYFVPLFSPYSSNYQCLFPKCSSRIPM